MSDINKREFTELALDGGNYLTWALDVEIYLASCDLSDAIVPDSSCSSAQKAKALIFLRHHLNKDLKNEYLTKKDPVVLWQSLKDRFDQQKAIILPQAQYDWLNLRFQDFKSVIEYNSTLHRIVSQLKLCKQEVTEIDLIEKTLSTFHASNLVLQQQYRAKNYTRYSELISALLVAEKHNQLLMRNHNARPVGSQAVPEAHATTYRGGRGRGRGKANWSQRGGRGWSHRGGRGRGRGRGYNHIARFQSHGKGFHKTSHPQEASTSQQTPEIQQTCYRCGCEGHWSRTCRTAKHLVEAYQMLQKNKKGKKIRSEIHHVSLPEANLEFNANDDDLMQLDLEDYGDQK
ncbi:uncharacterized protein LOC131008525 [Salvia miltiorrhiza]|uniref:uncharacterized protein LOC131008525 n=1 Tax=Salvia miltiorrhiza TaxID=226208 RepID=UPI0025ABBECC|nr:uncharacterized protein LOC131008525 [Salvia miltiorrhiza]